MKVLTHANEWVLVEIGDQMIKLVRCLDRHTTCANGPRWYGGETVQIWEDEQGMVIRLSRVGTPEASWIAHKWA